MADREDELETVEVDHKLSERQKFALYKDLEGYCSPWDASYVPSKDRQQKGKVSIERKKKKRRVQPHTTDQSCAQDSAICNCIFCCETSCSRTRQKTQQKVSTCNLPMLRDKLKDNVARITGHLPIIFIPLLTDESSTAAAERLGNPPASF